MPELSDTEYAAFRQLLDKEQIRELKRLYAHFMDDGQIDALADLFTATAVCDFGPAFGRWEGRETIRTNYRAVFEKADKFDAMHHLTNHQVQLTGDDSASGRSYLIDVVTRKPADEQPVVWFGLYDEDYRKVDGRWLIDRCAIQFLWPSRMTLPGFENPWPPATA